MLKNQKRKVGIAVLSALTLGCAVTAGVLADNNATQVNADAPTTFAMVDGASVRLDTEQYGLRFSAEIGSAYTETANISYHMMIIPVKWIEKYGLSGTDFNGDYMTTLQSALKAEAEAGKGLGEDGKTQRTIATVDCTPKYIEKATAYYKANTWYISGSLTSIKYGNLNGDFFGLAYTLDNKGTVEDASDDSYTYATFVAGENERNAVYVASAAYQSGEFLQGSAEQSILFKLVNQGLHSANGDDESAKDTTYAFNPGLESKKYILKGDQYQLTVSGIPAKAKLKAVWTSVDPSVATVDENGLVTAGDKAGSTSVSCDVFGKKISCLIEVGDRQTETKELGDYVLNSTSFSERDFEQAGIVGEVSGVTIGKTALECTAYSYAEGKLTIPYETIKSYFGENVTIKVETAEKDYVYTANIITLLVTEASQFVKDSASGLNALQSILYTKALKPNQENQYYVTYTGYFVLGNDINFGNSTLISDYAMVGGSGLDGTFDGRGHTISNVALGNYSSILCETTKNAVVKDVNFENLQQTSMGSGVGGYFVGGTWTNVNVSGYISNTDCGGLLGSGVFGKLTLNNCTFVVKADEKLSAKNYIVISGANNLILNNVTVYTNQPAEKVFNNDSLKNAVVSTTWGTDTAKVGQDYVLELGNVTKILWDGEDITSDCTMSASSVTIPAEKITAGLHDVKAIGDTAAFLTVTAEYDVEKKTETIDFSHYITTGSIDETTGKVLNGTYAKQAFEYPIEGEPVAATINGLSANDYLMDNVFVIPADKIADYYGETVVVISTSKYKYTLNVTFATLVITDAYQLVNNNTEVAASLMQLTGGLKDGVYTGYFVLGNNIDFESKAVSLKDYQNPSKGFSKGTFDGREYTISNLKIGSGSFFGGVLETSTIKNVRFENLRTEKSAGVCGYFFGGVWQNVYISATLGDLAWGALLGANPWRNFDLIDCTFVIQAEETALGQDKGVLFTGDPTYKNLIKLSNVTIITNHTKNPTNTVTGDTPGTTCESFTNVTVVTGATFSEVAVASGNAYTAEVAGVTAVLLNGKDVTGACKTATGVNVPSDKLTAGKHQLVIVTTTDSESGESVTTATVVTITVS